MEERLLLADSIGLFNSAASQFFLKNTISPGLADTVVRFGPAGLGWQPLAGDWNNNDADTIGLFKPDTSTFLLKNSQTPGLADVGIRFGPMNSGWEPLSGDWSGNGTDSVGLFVPATSTFFLKNTHTPGPADLGFRFGPVNSGWQPLTGDWNNNGVDSPGLYDPVTGTFYLRNFSAGGPADTVVRFGPPGVNWVAVVGDWDGDGDDTIGLFDPAVGKFMLKNTNTPGPADLVARFGPAGAGWTPLAGDWAAPGGGPAESLASYNLTIENFWSQAHHESWAQAFADVNSPHFSHLGGATHKGDLTIWEPGGFSSTGVIHMQETGWIDNPNPAVSDFKAEFDVHQANGDAEFFLNYPEHFAAGSATVRDFDVSESHPFVTLFSMLGPTPDWFIGVDGVNLRDTGGGGGSTDGWLNTVVVDLFTYDGGTRTEDENFALFGTPENPQKAIELISNTPNPADPDRTALNSLQIGRFTFDLQSVVFQGLSPAGAAVSEDSAAIAVSAALVNPFAQRSLGETTGSSAAGASPVVSSPIGQQRKPSPGDPPAATSASALVSSLNAGAELGIEVTSESQASTEAVDHALLELLGDGLLEGGSVEPSEWVLV